MQVAGNVGVTGTVATTSIGGSQQAAPAVQTRTAAPAYAASQPAVAAQPTMERSLLSEKLDNILREAKIDGNLMESLRDSIKNFEAAAKGIAPTVETVASSNRYAEEMAQAAQQLETLNSMYKVQLESATKNADINREVAENNLKLKEQMMSLTSNLSTLNAVYGGMLSAMGKTAN